MSSSQPKPDHPSATRKPSALSELFGGGGLGAASKASEEDAERDVVELLKAGRPIPASRRSLAGRKLVGIDLAGADLSGWDLSGADLSRARLAGVPLAKANLEGAVLYEADLSGCECLAATFVGANLTGANLERGGFGKADFTDAQMIDVKLSQAALAHTDFTRADLRNAHARGVRALEAKWVEADLGGADLRGAELDQGHVRGASFDGADLREASLVRLEGYLEASWIGVDMRDIDFTGAYLCRRFIMDQNYLEEFRRQTRFSEAIYQVWWATSDCGRSIVRWGVCIAALVLAFAWLFTLVDVSYGDHETALSPVYYSVVTLTTLGYGDALPASTAAQVVAMVEVLFGYVMLGGLLSIISNKMVRRAE